MGLSNVKMIFSIDDGKKLCYYKGFEGFLIARMVRKKFVGK